MTDRPTFDTAVAVVTDVASAGSAGSVSVVPDVPPRPLAALRLDDVSKVYGRGHEAVPALDGVSLEVAAGEWDDAERIVRERMGDAAQLTVPLDVQIGRGANWNDAGH